MDFLCEFFESTKVYNNEDFSFKHFKELWKEARLQYIWLLKHPQEPQEMFFNELATFVVDRLLQEYQLPSHERSLAIYVAATYSMAILYQTQPVIRYPEIKFPSFQAEATEERHCILLPEYVFDAIVAVFSALKRPEKEIKGEKSTHEAFETLSWMFKMDAFIFCVERPVRYLPGGKSPYPKERHPQVFTNGSVSRLPLNNMETICNDTTFAALSRHHNKYEDSLRKITGGSNIPGAGKTFLQELQRCRKDHEKWKERVHHKRSLRKNTRFMNDWTLPIRPASTLCRPISKEVKEDYFKACKRYQKLTNCQQVSDHESENEAMEENQKSTRKPKPRINKTKRMEKPQIKPKPKRRKTGKKTVKEEAPKKKKKKKPAVGKKRKSDQDDYRPPPKRKRFIEEDSDPTYDPNEEARYLRESRVKEEFNDETYDPAEDNEEEDAELLTLLNTNF